MISIKNSLFNDKPIIEVGGVYKINCASCNIPSIGQTGKELSKRIDQPKYSVRTANDSNGIFCHVRDFNHPIDWHSAIYVFKSSSLLDRLLVEGCLINSFINMNLTDGLFKMDELLKHIIKNDPKVKQACKYFIDHSLS